MYKLLHGVLLDGQCLNAPSVRQKQCCWTMVNHDESMLLVHSQAKRQGICPGNEERILWLHRIYSIVAQSRAKPPVAAAPANVELVDEGMLDAACKPPQRNAGRNHSLISQPHLPHVVVVMLQCHNMTQQCTTYLRRNDYKKQFLYYPKRTKEIYSQQTCLQFKNV